MARDAPAMTPAHMGDSGDKIPEAIAMRRIREQDGDIVTIVPADTNAYRRQFNNRAVKKTLPIPQRMNEATEKGREFFAGFAGSACQETCKGLTHGFKNRSSHRGWLLFSYSQKAGDGAGSPPAERAGEQRE